LAAQIRLRPFESIIGASIIEIVGADELDGAQTASEKPWRFSGGLFHAGNFARPFCVRNGRLE
jgi:hypothetical protein